MHEPDEVQAHGATRQDINTAPAKGEKKITKTGAKSRASGSKGLVGARKR